MQSNNNNSSSSNSSNINLESKESLEKLFDAVINGLASPLDDVAQKKLICTEKGTIRDIIANYEIICKNDKIIQSHIKFNEFSRTLELDGKPFTDADLVTFTTYFSSVYELQSKSNLFDVLNRYNVPCYHPIKDKILEGIDEFRLPTAQSSSYIDNFFQNVCHKVAKDDDETIYFREVARMIFYGGIKRLFEPGSKFDYFVIFEGKQGTGKSRLVEMLNPVEKYYSDLRTIDGKEACECIDGSFIIELSELLALVRAKDVEAMKAFITRTVDKYRPAYGRYTAEVPRCNVFIGTTNDASFLTDVTGNRRYLPINIDETKPYEFFEGYADTKKYIMSCWKEAYLLYKAGKIYTNIPSVYNPILEAQRKMREIDNPVIGAIIDYVENYDPSKRCYEDKVCALEIYINCMNGLKKNYSRQSAKEIANIMSTIPGWSRNNKACRFKEYGPQKYWQKENSTNL